MTSKTCDEVLRSWRVYLQSLSSTRPCCSRGISSKKSSDEENSSENGILEKPALSSASCGQNLWIGLYVALTVQKLSARCSNASPLLLTRHKFKNHWMKKAQRRDLKKLRRHLQTEAKKQKNTDEETTSKFLNNTALVCELGEVDSATILVTVQCCPCALNFTGV